MMYHSNRLTKLCVLTLILVAFLLKGCKEKEVNTTTPTPSEEVSNDLVFPCEYNYYSGYEVFPGGNYNYVTKESADVNTKFELHEGVPLGMGGGPDFETTTDIREHVNTWAEHKTGGAFEGGIQELEHRLYLFGAAYFDNGDYNRWGLGGTLNLGNGGHAVCVIWKDHIDDNLDALINGGIQGVNSTSMTEFAVLHELGHGRAALQHLCDESTRETDHSKPNKVLTCVMANRPYNPACLGDCDPGPCEQPIRHRHYCDKCDDKLKNVAEDW